MRGIVPFGSTPYQNSSSFAVHQPQPHPQRREGSFEVVPKTLWFVIGREVAAPLIKKGEHTFNLIRNMVSRLDQGVSSLFFFPGAEAATATYGESCPSHSELISVSTIPDDPITPQVDLDPTKALLKFKKKELVNQVEVVIRRCINYLRGFCQESETLLHSLEEILDDLREGRSKSPFYPDSRAAVELTLRSTSVKSSLKINGAHYVSYKIRGEGLSDCSPPIEKIIRLVLLEFTEVFNSSVHSSSRLRKEYLEFIAFIDGLRQSKSQNDFESVSKGLETLYKLLESISLNEFEELTLGWKRASSEIEERVSKEIFLFCSAPKMCLVGPSEQVILALVERIRNLQHKYLSDIETPWVVRPISPDGYSWEIKTVRGTYDLVGRVKDWSAGGETLFKFTTRRGHFHDA